MATQETTITVTLTPEEAQQLQAEIRRLRAIEAKQAKAAPKRKPAAKVPAPKAGTPARNATHPGHARTSAKPTPPKGRPPARVRTILPPPTPGAGW